MCNGVIITSRKSHLKDSALKKMLNEKYHTPQHNLGKKMHKNILKPLHTRWKINPKEACSIINTRVDPTYFYFQHDTLVNKIH